MANVNFSSYGFLNDILALDEDNWRKYFKPFVYDSVQSGLEVSAGTGMTFNVSIGECRCGAVMGVLNSSASLDVQIGDANYDRIDSIVVQYSQGSPSTLSLAVVEGTPSANPVPQTLTKSFNTLWQMEIAQILVPNNSTTASQCTITDKRVIYTSIDSVIDPIESEITSITTDINSINVILNKEILYFYHVTVNSATSAEMFRITDTRIDSNTVLLECTFDTPSNITSNVSWQSNDASGSNSGYIKFTGTCTSGTYANVTLGRKSN